MKRRNILKRIGTAGIVAAGVTAGSASASASESASESAPASPLPSDIEELTITFNDDREDVDLSDCCYGCPYCSCPCCYC